MEGDLSRFEKIVLDYQARKDVERKTLERVVPLDHGVSPRKVVPDGADPNSLQSVLFSSFIDGELRRFISIREHKLGGKKVRFWLYNDGNRKKYQRMLFPGAIARINSQIERYKVELNRLANDFSERLADLDRQRKHYEQTGELHMVQMCVNRARQARSDYSARTHDYYVGIVELLGQKAELLDTMRGRLKDKRARVYGRIHYYLKRACTYRPALGPENMPDQILEKFADMTLLGDYQAAWEDTLRQQTHYTNEFNTVQNW